MAETLKLKKEYIQLNQLLKVMGWAISGGVANGFIDDGHVKVNDKIETRRRNKLYKGFKIEFEGQVVVLE